MPKIHHSFRNISRTLLLESWQRTRKHARHGTRKSAISRGRRAPFAAILLGLAAGGSCVQAAPPSPNALPTGEQIVAGSATVHRAGNEMTIDQGTHKLITNWQSFHIGASAGVTFHQPTAASIALNRVTNQNPTQILGRLSANGHVMLVNPSGVVFGQGSQINVGGITASTLAITDSDFLAGNYRFAGGATAGEVLNQGAINTAANGVVALIAPVVRNEGTINTPRGATALAAGEAVTVDFTGDGLITVTVDKARIDALAENKGLIRADQGLVVLTAGAVRDVLSGAVNNEGVIEARGLTRDEGGRILLTGGAIGNRGDRSALSADNVELAAGRIVNEGVLSANGRRADGTGEGGTIRIEATQSLLNTGKITATGETGGRIDVDTGNGIDGGQWDVSGEAAGGEIDVAASGSWEQTAAGGMNASGGLGDGGNIRVTAEEGLWLSGSLDASGAEGGSISVTASTLTLAGSQLHADGAGSGGRIRVGGGWQGGDADLANARETRVSASTTLTANAGEQGDGGVVVVWSEEMTAFAGVIEAMGGKTAGDGGQAEVSSHDRFSFTGDADLSAVSGAPGTLLLDPKNIVIDDTLSMYNLFPLTYVTPQAGDKHGAGGVVVLTNGNVVVVSPDDNTMASASGAVRLYQPDGTLLATLTGATASDKVGSGGVTALTNGHYVVASRYWDGSVSDVGAVTWGNGTTGITGTVSASNSLVGVTAYDQVGYGGVTALTNGHYVVASLYWDNAGVSNAGAVTWGNGTTGITGTVSASNSLVGATESDQMGSGGITALTNDHYVVASPYWDNDGVSDAGAVTWGNGTNGITGAVSASNSLVGATENDRVGFDGVTALTNGHYVVASHFWGNGSVSNAGAVTWGDGTSGITGEVSAGNSLVGATAKDYVGNGGVTALTNGHYVVASLYWDGSVVNAGAVTWGDGTGGTVGMVSATNSLVGTTAYDQVGSDGVTALTNGHYVVASHYWDGSATDTGAVTWGDGTGGITGEVSAGNSLVGATAKDYVGNGGVTALTNGHYVVASHYWDGSVVNAGAVTWGDGTTGITGTVSASNSLVGTRANDWVGSRGVTALTNGHYVVASHYWDNAGAGDAGAVTWGDGTTGITGTIDASNSLVGTTANDQMGSGGVTALTNGHYVVASPDWDDGGTADVGRVDIVELSSPPESYIAHGDDADADYGFTAADLADLLKTGTAVVLQASNDITVNSAITVDNTGGDGGALTLQAGRSLLLNADITTDNGALNLFANDTFANGVVDAQRDAGAAVITMADGTAINAGTGAVSIELRDGAGKTNLESGDVSLTDINALTITVLNNGPTAGSGIVLDGTLTASATSGDGIVLAGDDFTNNTGATALSAGAGSRWLVWSEDPSADTRGSLAYDFKQYNAVYGVTTVEASEAGNNGFLYELAPQITPDLTSAVTKTYDGDNTATLAAANYTTDDAVDGDVITFNNPTAGTYSAGKNVGTGLTVDVTGISIVSTASSVADGSVTVYGYQLASGANTASGAVGEITAKALAVSYTATDKVYDGNTDATVTDSDDRVAGDVLTISETASFTDKNVGIGKTVNVTGIGITGTDAGNYSLASTTDSVSADITAKTLTVSYTGTNKVYDGGTTATVTDSDDRVTGDVLTIAETANFIDKNVGSGKTVNVTGIGITGTDAGNYSLALTTASASADITALALGIGAASAANKTYDGNTDATVTAGTLSGVIGDDTVTVSATGVFDDKNVGTGKTVSNTYTLGGTDGGNYALSSDTTTADITAKTLTVTYAGVNKVYDGATTATVTDSDDRVTGDALAITETANFTDAEVGTDKTVDIIDITLSGTDAGNYALAATTATTTADITADITAGGTEDFLNQTLKTVSVVSNINVSTEEALAGEEIWLADASGIDSDLSGTMVGEGTFDQKPEGQSDRQEGVGENRERNENENNGEAKGKNKDKDEEKTNKGKGKAKGKHKDQDKDSRR